MSIAHRVIAAILAAVALCHCAPPPDRTIAATAAARYAVTYYDRNGDGIVDCELHRAGGSDTDWLLCDTNFRGRYDLRLAWGEAYEEKPVDIPVPTGVKITRGKAPDCSRIY